MKVICEECGSKNVRIIDTPNGSYFYCRSCKNKWEVGEFVRIAGLKTLE